jgi:hypothetical protein
MLANTLTDGPSTALPNASQAALPVTPVATSDALSTATPATSTVRSTALPTCKCGTDRTRREATPEREYTFLGTLYALWGGTSVPSRVNFRCVHCGVVFDGCSDTETRRAFII